ncbi:MAG: hypothetical protein Q9227_001286 [Pyrenula ochraceoflavens]
MADGTETSTIPLNYSSVQAAHKLIAPHIHRTPLLTSKTLNEILSAPRHNGGKKLKINLFFKCENQQKIGAFKARGAHHAVLRLVEKLGIDEVKRRGVITHSSGNHAQALALASHTFGIPSYIVMPSISTPSKIAGTRLYTDNVIFSGSTSVEREAKVEEVVESTGAILVPPYDHENIILGQGTTGLEIQQQYAEVVGDKPRTSVHHNSLSSHSKDRQPCLDALISPLGGGGLLSGLCVSFSPPSPSSSTMVFGAEPSFSGADDGRRGLLAGERVPHVSSLTIADGLRTPVGLIPWRVISDRKMLEGIYSVTEDEIREAMRHVLERLKVWVEPSAVVGVAVAMFCEEFRRLVPDEGWDVGIVLTGGNTTVDAVVGLFGGGNKDEVADKKIEIERQEGLVGINGEMEAEDVAG